MPRESVGELEYLILLAILALGTAATAPSVRRLLTDEGRRLTRGALYRALDRLGEKALIAWAADEGDGGGHVRRRYTVTATGRGVVRQRRETLERLWAGAAEALDA